MHLTGSQRHEIAKISESAEIWEEPTEWNDATGVIPESSVVLTYRFPSKYNYHHYIEVIIEPNGTRHVVR